MEKKQTKPFASFDWTSFNKPKGQTQQIQSFSIVWVVGYSIVKKSQQCAVFILYHGIVLAFFFS